VTRRTIFNQVALEYDAIRPGYPLALIDDVIAISGIPAGGRILEVGCGTGQATLPFARRGYAMTCLDLGKELAAVAAEKLRPYPQVQIQNVSFEDWPPEPGAFDLVLSATAFHWVPREIGYPKAAQVLNDTGSIAIFANEHPFPHVGFFVEAQAIYRQVVPEWHDPREDPPIGEQIKANAVYIDRTGLFEPVVVKTYPWSQDYTAAEYLRLLNTYSDHHGLEESRRARLFAGLGEMIENRYGGRVTKEYLAVLYIARKRQPPPLVSE
jgi:SAM-dependent methyltransferase